MRIAAVCVAFVLAAGLAGACQKTPETGARAKAGKAAKPAEGETGGADAEKAETGAPGAGDAKARIAGEKKRAVVDGRSDPPWFRGDLVEGTVLSRQSRSVENQSMILLEFEPGTTAEDCVTKVTEKLQPHVALTSSPGTGKEGQLMVSGTTSEYRATVVCGEAKGKMRAYLGYQWLK